MTFPTIPTVASGRIKSVYQGNTTAARTSPDLSTLTKNDGDLLLAIVVSYQGSTVAANSFTFPAPWTEFLDSSTNSTIGIGLAYMWSDGTETGTFNITQGVVVVGHALVVLMSIPGAHPSTPPEAGGRASGTTTTATPDAFNPTGWDVEDTLWIALCGVGETALTGSYTGVSTTPPANYTDQVNSAGGVAADVVGAVDAAAAFRQLAAASEDPGNFGNDTSNARWGAVTIAVRPAPAPTTGAATGAVSWTGSATGARVSSGAASGALAYAGSATGATGHSGAASGSVAWSGAATGVAPTSVKQGAATGSVSWSGAATGARASAGSASGAVAWSGSAIGARASTGTASGTVVRVGVATGARASTGAVVGSLTYAGATTGARTSAGSVAGTVAWVGSATGSAPAIGASSGSVAGTLTWAGSATGARMSAGAAVGAVVWAGSASGSSAAALIIPAERTSTSSGSSRTSTSSASNRTSASASGSRTSTSSGTDRTSS